MSPRGMTIVARAVNLVRPSAIASSELSVGWVDPWVGSGRVNYSKSIKIFERIVSVLLKHG